MQSYAFITALLLASGWHSASVVEAQLGLLSSSLAGSRLSFPTDGGSLFTSSFSSGLLGKSGDQVSIPRSGVNIRESEIAAIFRGVAYGAVTETSTTTSTTTQSPTTTTRTTARFEDDVIESLQAVFTGFRKSENENLHDHKISTEVNHYVNNYNTMPYDLESNENVNNNDITDVAINHRIVESEVDMINGVTDQSEVVSVENLFPIPGVQWSLGAAWWIHVYVSAGLFALLSIASLICLYRISSATYLLPKGHFLILHLLILLAGGLRCLHLFHDPYRTEGRVPMPVSILIEESVWPCLIAALTVILLAIVQVWKCPRFLPRSAYASVIVAVITVANFVLIITFHLANSLVLQENSMQVTAHAITIIWGFVVGLGGLFSLWYVDRASWHLPGTLLGKFRPTKVDTMTTCGHPRIMIIHGARLVFVAAAAQSCLASLNLYILFSPLEPESPVWTWWVRVSAARCLELIIGASLLAAAAVFTKKQQLREGNNSTIFSLIGSCGKEPRDSMRSGRSANVYPTEKTKIINGFTLYPEKPVYDETLAIKKNPLEWTLKTVPVNNCINNKTSRADSITSDFQLLWKCERPPAPPRPNSMLVNESGFVRFRTAIDYEQRVEDVHRNSSQTLNQSPTHPSVNCQTLPTSRYYCTPMSRVSALNQTGQSPVHSNTVRPLKSSRPVYNRHQSMNNQTYSSPRHPVSSASKYDIRNYDDYEVASYYNSSNVSIGAGSNMYAVPHVMFPYNDIMTDVLPSVHRHIYDQARLPTPRSVEELSGIVDPGSCSSFSEIHVDYLTDISSTNDVFVHTSLPYLRRQPQSKTNGLTLPISPASGHCRRYNANTMPGHSMDVTPDSAVVLDYSSQTDPEDSPVHRSQNPHQLHLSTTSLNDVLKAQSRAGLLSKLVGSSMSLGGYGYSPLDVEESTSQPVDPLQGVNDLERGTNSGNTVEAIITISGSTCDGARLPGTYPTRHSLSPVTSL